VKKKRTRVVNTKWLSVDKLIISACYYDLFPLPRDASALVESFARDGYRPEYPLTVRASETVGDHFEIVCGVRRYELARERGMRRVPAVVREMTAEEAIRYAVEDNLFAAGCSASLTLPQAIFLSRLLEGRGRSLPPRLVWGLARVSESTFWRAVKSFDLAVGKAAGEHPELNEMEDHQRVAEILRRDLFPEFTRLWTGSLEVHTFRQAHAAGEGHGGSAGKTSRRSKPESADDARRAPGAPEPNDGHPSRGRRSGPCAVRRSGRTRTYFSSSVEARRPLETSRPAGRHCITLSRDSPVRQRLSPHVECRPAALLLTQAKPREFY
jgi:ParB-like nuclease domain